MEINQLTIGFFIGVVISIVGAVLCFTQRRAPEHRFASSDDDFYFSTPHLFAAFITLFAYALSYTLISNAKVGLFSADDYVRAEFSYGWTKNPYLATWDHVWLTGPVAVSGLVFKIKPDMEFVYALVHFTAGFLTTFGAFLITSILWRSAAASLIVGLLVASQRDFQHASVGAQSDVLAYGPMLFALAIWLYQATKPDITTRAKSIHLVVIGLLLCIAEWMRYEMWFLGFLYCNYAFVVGIIHWRKKVWDVTIASIIAIILTASTPVTWCLSSLFKMGSLFAFAEKSRELNIQTNLFYDLDSPFVRFTVYPRILTIDHWMYMSFVFIGIIISLLIIKRATIGTKQRAVYYTLAYLGLLLLSMIATYRSGIGSNSRPRYSLFLLLPLLPFAGLALGKPLSWAVQSFSISKIKSTLIIGVTVLFILMFCGTSVYKAHFFYPDAFGMRAGIVALAKLLRIEHASHRAPTYYGEEQLLWPGGVPLVVFTDEKNPINPLVLRYHSLRPYEIQTAYNKEQLAQQLASLPHKSRVLVPIESELPDDLADQLTHIHDFPPFGIYYFNGNI
jgi:hypothetical protein